MSAVVATVAQDQPQTRKRCTDCGVEKDLGEFYAKEVNPNSGRVIFKSYCKQCAIAAVLDRRARQMREVASVEAVSMVVLDRLPDQNGNGKSIYLRREDYRVSVTVEPAFNAPPPERFTLPQYGATPECPRGKHVWPLEALCRGYELLGCGGYGPHVHRRCPVHACEAMESAPAFVMTRRRA